jgi:peroxiredoxin
LLKQIDSSYAALLKEHQKYTRDFIYEHPSSLAAILALYQNFGRKSQPLFDKYDDLEVFDFVDSSLSVLYPHTEAVRALNREVTETKEQIEHSKYIEKRIVEGRPLPDLKEVSVTGDTILVDGEQHRNFLLYFWASWSAYSVDELTMLNEYAIQARPDAVTIITISIDSSQEMLKKCMDENNIRLPVICDYEYWESDLAGRYAIKKIPASILTNKAGIVIAKDIFSDELISKFKSPER